MQHLVYECRSSLLRFLLRGASEIASANIDHATADLSECQGAVTITRRVDFTIVKVNEVQVVGGRGLEPAQPRTQRLPVYVS